MFAKCIALALGALALSFLDGMEGQAAATAMALPLAAAFAFFMLGEVN